MPLAAIPAMVWGGIAAGAGSAAGAGIGAHAAGKAADAQSQAAMYAADKEYQASQEALAFQKQQYEQNQANMQPWLKSGGAALSNLDALLGLAPSDPSAVNPSLGAAGSLMQPYGKTFQAPTGLTEQNDPGFQARLKLGTDALERSAAARGGLMTGGTAKALNSYAQDYASNEYGNVYGRAWNQYANDYNQWSQNQANQYNRLASLAGVGQQTAGQLSTLGQAASNNVSNNLLGTAQNVGQQMNNAAAATASGYVGSGNAWNGALSGLGNNFSNLMMLQSLNKGMNPQTFGSLLNSGAVGRSAIDLSSLNPIALSLS